MVQLGLYPFFNEDDMISKTQVSEDYYKLAANYVPTRTGKEKTYTEEDIKMPKNPYGISKLVCEEIIKNFCKNNINVLRDEIKRICVENFTSKEIQDKFKKTYKNRYFILTNKK